MFRRLLVLTGLVALAAYLLRRRTVPAAGVEHDVDPAEELRRKLDETRARAEPEASELSDDLDARRREVHERARTSADEMRDSSSE
ncbi:MAG: hypothetical protein ABWY51_07215 [Gaiellaceae bacterium]